MPRDHTIAGDFLVCHTKVVDIVLDEHIPFLKGFLVEEHVDTLARSQFPLGVLAIDSALASAQTGGFALDF